MEESADHVYKCLCIKIKTLAPNDISFGANWKKGKIDIPDFRQSFERTTLTGLLAVGTFRRTSVLPQAKPRRRGGLADPEHFNLNGQSGLSSRRIYKKGHNLLRVLL